MGLIFVWEEIENMRMQRNVVSMKAGRDKSAGKRRGGIRRPGEMMTVNLDKSVKMDFVWVPPGEFLMGQAGVAEPVHRAQISRGFWLGKYLVTQTQFRTATGWNPSYIKGGNLPLEQVTWLEAMGYCAMVASLHEAATGHAVQGRLPTEAEWEYACRAGTTTDFNTGDGEAALVRAGWYAANSGEKSHPVGQKDPNTWGLHDMHGNVWEWCYDWSGPYPARAVSDPFGTSKGNDRVTRGGSWYNNTVRCRTAYRAPFGVPCGDDGNSSTGRSVHFGFRALLRD
jgi:formylglycine-generating enzyme required for sulfatase activity